MLPLRDNIPSRSTPFVNYGLILACSLVFVAQLADTEDGHDQLVEQYGMIPARVFHPDRPVVIEEREVVRTPFGLQQRLRERQLAQSTINPWFTLLTCIFLHGGWMHVIGNLWVLYIFGDNVEDCFGHLGYLVFYIACGVLASFAHLAVNSSSNVPTIGASGAIAGVMGAYLLLYPRAMVLTLVPIFFFIQIVVLPAPVFLGFWFLLQFFQGTFSILATEGSGVAWWAHIGGFLAGFGIAWELRKRHQLRPQVDLILPNTDRPRIYRRRG